MTQSSNLTMEDDRDPQLQALFANSVAPLQADPGFTQVVMQQVEQQKRLRTLRRALVALAVALLAIPLQDYALALSQVLIVSLVEIESGLVAQLLAPINSVGGLFSVMVLGIRIMHKRLFN